jgi:hypothetical protein
MPEKLEVRKRFLPSTSFPVHHSLITASFDGIPSKLMTALGTVKGANNAINSVNKSQFSSYMSGISKS